jgi:hypothetical protein
MTVSMHRTVAALNLPTRTSALIVTARVIVLAMTDNRTFPNPTPSLAEVTAALEELSDAETATQMRTRGNVAVRNAKRAALVPMLMRLKAYVQERADGDTEHAVAIIESAGMHIKPRGVGPKPIFAVQQGRVSGSVVLTYTCAAHRASYQWEWSLDGGTTWHAAPPTLQAKTRLSGLTPATLYTFRVRPVVRSGELDWSDPVSILLR